MTQIIILAAGKGTRMGLDMPKVLVPLKGKAMIDYLVEAIYENNPEIKPIVVVSPDNIEIIKNHLGRDKFLYAVQEKQMGTGSAVSSASSFIDQRANNVLVLYGDNPFISADAIKNFLNLEPSPLTIITTSLADFDNWHQNFYGFGRIIRDKNLNIQGIIELKDASEEEKNIKEVNAGFMCFEKNWLISNINKLKNNNKAQEFYLTDMVKIAFNDGHKIDSFSISPREAMGINSLDELNLASGL